MTAEGTGPLRLSWLGRAGRAAAVAGLAVAVVVLTLWAVPATHPPPARREVWTHWDDTDTQDVVQHGLARHGYVWQQRWRVWGVPRGQPPPDRGALRAADAGRPLSSSAAADDGWALGSSSYGINHVFSPDGRSFGESGLLVSVPYVAVAAVAALPAIAWGCVAARRRWR